MPVQAVAVLLRAPARRQIPVFYHRVCLAIMGIRLVTRGQRVEGGPTLFVSNHSSYLDIEVLGSLLEASFIAKREVAGWPLFGLLARLQNSVFVDRHARGRVHHQRDVLKERLAAGDSLILFPEGTSSDGNCILPFKSALFSAAAYEIEGRPVQVQPISVTATALDGIPLGRTLRPVYAWYGDMSLAPHIWTLLTLGELTVEIAFHEPVTLAQCGSRKALSDHCWAAVATGVWRAVAGQSSQDCPVGIELPSLGLTSIEITP